MHKNASLLEAGLLVRGRDLVPHTHLHLGRAHLQAGNDDGDDGDDGDDDGDDVDGDDGQAHLEAGDDRRMVGQCGPFHHGGSSNGLVLHLDWR